MQKISKSLGSQLGFFYLNYSKAQRTAPPDNPIYSSGLKKFLI